jgi:hypothetical protein
MRPKRDTLASEIPEDELEIEEDTSEQDNVFERNN